MLEQLAHNNFIDILFIAGLVGMLGNLFLVIGTDKLKFLIFLIIPAILIISSMILLHEEFNKEDIEIERQKGLIKDMDCLQLTVLLDDIIDKEEKPYDKVNEYLKDKFNLKCHTKILELKS